MSGKTELSEPSRMRKKGNEIGREDGRLWPSIIDMLRNLGHVDDYRGSA